MHTDLAVNSFSVYFPVYVYDVGLFRYKTQTQIIRHLPESIATIVLKQATTRNA